MAQTVNTKILQPGDVTNTKTVLHEAIPITGSLLTSGSVSTAVSDSAYEDANIKKYAHGMFQSVYDYPYLSSSANHLMDITCGIKSGSDFVITNESFLSQSTNKYNNYSQMAKVLVGHDATGAILPFRLSGSYLETVSTIDSPVFLNFSRLLVKDEIQKGSFQIKLGTGSFVLPFEAQSETLTISDYKGTSSYGSNSPVGDYGVLYSGTASPGAGGDVALGIIYYQAGIAVLDVSGAFREAEGRQAGNSPGGDVHTVYTSQSSPAYWQPIDGQSYSGSLISSSVDQISQDFRHRVDSISFNNSIELNSTIYFCRAAHHEFNYSSNPTYLSASEIIVKESEADIPPKSYITTVGLYGSDNELLATAKLSEPIRKDPTNEVTIRVRLDY
jgi:hypothetical protein